MPLLYLAKVNLNSNIFELYEKKLNIKDVTKLIYEKFSVTGDYLKRTKERYYDSLGNQNIFYKESVYSFQEIEKFDNGIITGKLVRSFNKPSEKLDETTNKMITCYITEATSIYFYFDVFNEMITFCERQSFGYNQFTTAFTKLLNRCVTPYKFEIFLQKDKDVLEEKLKTLTTVQKVHATLIPPNSNNEDGLNELAEELQYMSQCKETNATKIYIEYSSTNLNMDSKIMKDIKKAVSNGYGDVNATGISSNGKKQTISSSQDAAYTTYIQENVDKNDFKEESKNMISRFLSKTLINLSHRMEM